MLPKLVTNFRFFVLATIHKTTLMMCYLRPDILNLSPTLVNRHCAKFAKEIKKRTKKSHRILSRGNRSAIVPRTKLETYILNREYSYTTESYAHNKNIKVFKFEVLSVRVLTYSATPPGFCCDIFLCN